jgi:3D (Asp-Asp-Asp) domain-containing protein
VTIKPNDNFTYQFPVQAGQATFNIKPQFDAKLDIQVFQNGAQVAQDVGGNIKTNFTLTWQAQAGATVQVKVKSTDTLVNQCTVSFNQVGGVVPPPPPPPPVGGVIQKNGPFTETQNIKPNDKFTYQFPVQAGQCTFNIKPQFDAILNVQVLQNGVQVAQDVGGGVKKDFNLSWNAAAPGNVQVLITSTDNLTNQCTISFNQGGGVVPPPPPPPVGGVIQKNGPFTDNQTIKPNDQFTYQFPVQAGQATFTIKPQFDAKLDIQIFQNGVLVAQDVGGNIKTNFVLNWQGQAGATTQVKIKSTDNLTNNCTISFGQGGGGVVNPPPAGGFVLNVNGNCPVGGFQFHNVQLQAGTQYTINLKTLQAGYDPYLELYNPTGQLVAQDDDSGGFPNAKIVYTPTVAGNYQLKCRSFGNSSGGAYSLTVEQGGGGGVVPPPPAGGVIQKNGPFTETQNIKPNDKFTYQFPVQAGQCTFNIKPQFDAILNVQVLQNGAVVAQDQNGGVKKNFALTWNSTAAGNVTVTITSTDNLTNQCTISFSQGGGVPIPPPPPPKKEVGFADNAADFASEVSFVDDPADEVAASLQVGGAPIVKAGPFTEQKTIKPAESFTYQVQAAAGQNTFTIKPQFDAKLDIKVMQNNILVAQDTGGQVKTNFVLNWNATAAGPATISVVSTDNLTNQCTITFASGGANPVPLPPVQPGGAVMQKPGPFTEVQNIKPNDSLTYQFPVKAGQATFNIKPQFDAKLDIQIFQNGTLVGQDVGGNIKTNFTLNWQGQEGATVQVKIKSTDNLANQCTISFTQGGANPNPNPGVGAPAPTVKGNCPVGGTTMHTVQLQAGQNYTIDLKTLQAGYDPYLWLINPTGQIVAQDDDSGGFPNSRINYTATVAGNYQLKVGSFANGSGGMYELSINNNALISQGPGAPPPPPPPPQPGGIIKKEGPFTDNITIKPNDKFTYEFPVKAGQANFTIKPQFDAKATIQIMQDGKVVAQDSGLKTNFPLTWNATAGKATVTITSTDTLTNNCMITFSQGGVVPPPPAGGGGAPPINVNGNCPNNGFMLHKVDFKQGVKYQIDLKTLQAGYDPYLELRDPTGTLVAQDDDSGGFPNARIIYTPTVSGTFEIKCRGYMGSGGQYNLIVVVVP